MNSVSSFFDPVQRQFSTVLDGKFWTKGKVITVSVVIGVLGSYMAYRLYGGFFNAIPSVPNIPHIPNGSNLTQNLAHKTFGTCSAVQNFFLNGTCPAVAKTTSLSDGFFNAVPSVPKIPHIPFDPQLRPQFPLKQSLQLFEIPQLVPIYDKPTGGTSVPLLFGSHFDFATGWRCSKR